MANLDAVIDHVAAMEDPAMPRPKVAAIVRETIGALGLAVNENSGEVYAPPPAPAWKAPEDRSLTYARRPRRARARR
jgi:hypothetical protein